MGFTLSTHYFLHLAYQISSRSSNHPSIPLSIVPSNILCSSSSDSLMTNTSSAYNSKHTLSLLTLTYAFIFFNLTANSYDLGVEQYLNMGTRTLSAGRIIGVNWDEKSEKALVSTDWRFWVQLGSSTTQTTWGHGGGNNRNIRQNMIKNTLFLNHTKIIGSWRMTLYLGPNIPWLFFFFNS